MRRTLAMAVISSLLTVAVSCEKSAQPPASNAVTGNWNFVSVNVQSETIAVQNGDTSISYPNYITQQNSGTIDFTVDSMAVKGLGYAVDTSFYTYFYMNGVVVDTVSSPLIGSIPPTSMGIPYKMVNTDSLYIANAGIFFPAGAGSANQGLGANFVVSGDTLRITSHINDTASAEITIGKAVVTLVKQH
jgi:hypothetical protein